MGKEKLTGPVLLRTHRDFIILNLDDVIGRFANEKKLHLDIILRNARKLILTKIVSL